MVSGTATEHRPDHPDKQIDDDPSFIQRSDSFNESSPEASTPQPPPTPPEPSGPGSEQRDMPQQDNSLHYGHVFISIVFAIFLLLLIVTASNPLYAFISTCLAILPTGFLARAISLHLRDDAVPRSFLFSQFILGAVVLPFGIMAIELMLTVVLIGAFFRNEAAALSAYLNENPTASSDDTTQHLFELLKTIPIWKLLLLALLAALVIAALCEEAAKWMLARRFRRVNHIAENMAEGRRIGVRGVLAIASTGALGFAAVENLGYTLGLAEQSSIAKAAFPVRLVGVSILRDVLAYPLHIGTQFFIALAAAQRYLMNDGPSVIGSFFVGVLFHGMFDLVAFVGLILVASKIIPAWVGSLVLVLQLGFVVLLVMLCRSRYTALIERENAVSSEHVPV